MIKKSNQNLYDLGKTFHIDKKEIKSTKRKKIKTILLATFLFVVTNGCIRTCYGVISIDNFKEIWRII